MSKIKRIAVFTSGGDAPGMNAAIRAVVRTATYHDLHIYGIKRGYDGMINGQISRLETSEVGNIIHRGGTVLKTARSMGFMTEEGRKQAYEQLKAYDIDGLVAIGGNGTLTGAMKFSEEFNIPIIGLPGTIDNDLYGSDHTIGFDTALNTAIEAIDKVRDTADSHNRIFFVEVMGRHSGFIALHTGIGSGASSILIPEADKDINNLKDTLKKGLKRKKLFGVIVVAEGNKYGGAMEVAKKFSEENSAYEVKVTVIGHLQRGGSPTCADRVLASRLGHSAVEALIDGKRDVMVGVINNKVCFTPFIDAIEKQKSASQDLINMAEILAL